jgi:hypothetical protein
MSSIMRKFKYFAAGAIAVAGVAMAIPAAANASGESADMSFDMTPRSGSFFKDAYRPADWNVRISISTADPVILPMKVADLTLPPKGQMTFNIPNNMPVCPDSQVGPPPTNVSVPVETIVARCPQSVIGNGTATFVLNRNNVNPAAALDGYIVIFNGGEVNGEPKLKIYAFSYDTGVGIYTSGTLSPQGKLVFNIPQLTSDSSVSLLDIKLPGKKESYFLPNQQITVNLPAGEASNYVQAKCNSNSFAYAGSFALGTRDTNNDPTSPTTIVQDSGSTACTGATGKAKIGSVKVSGPSKTKRNKKTTYKVKIKNTGTATAKGVRLKVTGKGVSFNASVGKIAAGKTKTAKVTAKFTKRGKVKAKFKVTSNNAGGKTAKKTVKVK